jgi:iron complex outermembrane receptor protein
MDMKITLHRRLWLAAASTAVLAASPALAAASSDTVAEVIVTAQKRSENLQKVPLGVSVAGQELLRDNAIGNAESLSQVIPSLTFKKGTANVNSTLSVRGIGTQSFSSGAEPSVSTVVDGVVFGRSGMAVQEFTDLERIEVLRGPQGTLFGKNASAGVVNIITKGPTKTLTGDVSVAGFDGDEFRSDFNVSGPLSDTTGFAVSGVATDFKGNIYNAFTKKWTNGYQHSGLRAVLTHQFTPDLLVTLRADYVKSNDNCCADVLGTYVPGPNPTPINNILAPSILPVKAYYGSKEVYHDLTPGTIDGNGGLSGQVDYDVKGFRLTSITAWRNWRNKQIRDGDFHATNSNYANPIDVADRDYGALNYNQYSQELRLSTTEPGKLQYVVGAFFWYTHENDWFNRFVDQCLASTSPADASGFKPCTPTTGAFIHAQGPAAWRTAFENQALFGQATYEVTDKLKLIGGLRLSHDTVRYSLTRTSYDPSTPSALRPSGIQPTFHGAEKADKIGVSGKLGAEYQLTPDHLVYATYSRGYKGPSLNNFYSENAINMGTIQPETSNAYEIGAKNQYFDHRLTINADVFWEDFSHFQANTFVLSNGATTVTLGDAGDVRARGVEIDASWKATSDLTFSGGYTYDDATIVSYNCKGAIATGVATNISKCLAHNGKPLPFAPKNKYNVTAVYNAPLPPSVPFDLKLATTYSYTSTINFDLDQSSLARQPSYGLWDLTATFATKDGRYRLAIIGKNLTDQYYTTFITPGGPGPAAGKLAPLQPGSFTRLQVPRDAQAYWGAKLTASF